MAGLGTQQRSRTCQSYGCSTTADCNEKCSGEFDYYTTELSTNTVKYCAWTTGLVLAGDVNFETCKNKSALLPTPRNADEATNLRKYFDTIRAGKSPSINHHGRLHLGGKRIDGEWRWVHNREKITWTNWHGGHPAGAWDFLALWNPNIFVSLANAHGGHNYPVICFQGPRVIIDDPMPTTMDRQCGGTLLDWEEWTSCACHDNRRQRTRFRLCNCWV